MPNSDLSTQRFACERVLCSDLHIDDAVDELCDLIGWDETFQTLAEMDTPRAAAGLYSMVCGLFMAA